MTDIEADLRREFPDVYHEPIECGAYVPPGWVTLVRELSDELEPIFSTTPRAHRPVVQQIKAKLGGLRFYISKGSQVVHDIITKYEVKSEETCEKCGLAGSGVNQRGWIAVLCEGCRGTK